MMDASAPAFALIGQPIFWAVAVPAVILLGLAKGGFMGVGNLAMPLLVLAMPPVQAAAIMLPVLILGDIVGVVAFRKTWDRHCLIVLLPSAVIGIGLGYVFAASVRQDVLLGALGLISIAFAGQQLWARRGGRSIPAHRLPDWAGMLCGAASGFTSQVAHAGAPPFQLWVLPRQLERDVLIGTTAIFFAAVNWIKVPAYAALGQFTPVNLVATAALLPIAFGSTLLGVKLVRMVPVERFYTFVLVLTAGLGVFLLYEALK